MRSLFEAAPPPAMSVAELCRAIKGALEGLYDGPIRVIGEVSRFRTASSGHMYFDLKDERGLVSCVCWNDVACELVARESLTDGLAVEVTGRLSAYAPRSQYQFVVLDVVPVGFGELFRRFEMLKAKLKAEGLFAADRKRPIPSFIRRVAIVTSREAAVLQDFVTTSRRRGAHVEILLVHAPVQGEASARAIAAAIRRAARLAVDAIVVARGGGSIEDLWAFNTEIVARAIASSAVPVISAIGHETDFTIADFVADLRAPTPTAAAEMVAAERDLLLGRLDAARLRLRRALQRLAGASVERLGRMRADLHRTRTQFLGVPARRLDDAADGLRRLDPRRGLAETRARVFQWRRRLRLGVEGALSKSRSELDVVAARLSALGPRETLARGYAIVYDAGGRVVTDPAAVAIGETIDVELPRGGLLADVRKKKARHGSKDAEEEI